ncbi:hypothetical protein EIN_488130 [Entamoeba invadens IP1]|uniref:Leucine rich repeat containing protein BspA family protein n=1 Tax=Entamoeba invadens IP1 TaxID=370355 RepID=A0A0A1U4W1_ENTIV|nr:hypothetical protein EIN_488130 [Entamoeba invadens IP1]ELP89291.1 hypothetical protein EIN_488130 [Entamoeba invadens IP1]|eukprot:XP_004256062.1 hypothetical protein EIN_488130 [Entamoeba invadens IP1]
MTRLDSYSLMVVAKYFRTCEDFENVQCVCRKFRETTEKFHFNPIPLAKKTRALFPKLETLHLYDASSEKFDDEDFFSKIFWYQVDYQTYKIFMKANDSKPVKTKNSELLFMNVKYTTKDQKKFGIDIPPVVTLLGEECFSYCDTLTSVVLSNSVKSIGRQCFFHCVNLLNAKLPESVSSIGFGAFSYCYKLSEITMPRYMKSIGNYCFDGCKELKKITIPNGVEVIHKKCFNNCKSLREINIPQGLKELEEGAFYGCKEITNLGFVTKVIKFGKGCFGETSVFSWGNQIPNTAFVRIEI